MTHRLYPRLAWQGITKNKRLYLPFLLTCVGMVMMTYILLSLASSPLLKTLPGGDAMPMILGLGSFTMAAFAVLFLFYMRINSRSTKEVQRGQGKRRCERAGRRRNGHAKRTGCVFWPAAS